MTDYILRRTAVERMVGLSRSTIYQMMSTGAFPKPIRIGKRAVGWKKSAIASWIDGREFGGQR
jgi:prophage regulatory protein